MGHDLLSLGHNEESHKENSKNKVMNQEDFVLEKSIFSNIFDKDIRRVFMYKKAERLAKAIHLIAPAFTGTDSLKNKIDAIAIGLVEGAILPASAARAVLSRELLTLSSVLAIARTSGLLSAMNAELISKEARFLLQEVASYEEPRLSLDDVPTLSEIAKTATKMESVQVPIFSKAPSIKTPPIAQTATRSVKDTSRTSEGHIKERREAILSVIQNKGQASIKDISHVVRGVSEKTVQRELMTLIKEGLLIKQGERRWSLYSLA
jgi:DNA-binding transcriptional ArsR family regulator